jgi:hypothetical protein
MMDPTTIFDVAEKAALTTVVTQALQEMVQRLKGKVNGKDKKEIRHTTEKIVEATMDDVYRFDPKFQAINNWEFNRKTQTRYMRRLGVDAARKTASKKSGRRTSVRRKSRAKTAKT